MWAISFSSEIKSELSSANIKSGCCRRALFNGIVFSRGREKDGVITVPSCFGLSAHLASEFFGRQSVVSDEDGVCRLLSRQSLPVVHGEITGEIFSERCKYCKQHFFRGVFLACGRITDPSSAYHLEFCPVSASALAVKLSDAGFDSKYTRRRSEEILYIKNSSEIEDFFAYIGANNAAFSVMNSKIENDVRNMTNRLVNCETNNIAKAVSASKRQIEAIEALERANKLSFLPPELAATAKLRLEHRDLSIAQLSQISVPPISKPGLSHRLKKIIELSESLLSSGTEKE